MKRKILAGQELVLLPKWEKQFQEKDRDKRFFATSNEEAGAGEDLSWITLKNDKGEQIIGQRHVNFTEIAGERKLKALDKVSVFPVSWFRLK